MFRVALFLLCLLFLLLLLYTLLLFLLSFFLLLTEFSTHQIGFLDKELQ
jgi:hypothetical protein